MRSRNLFLPILLLLLVLPAANARDSTDPSDQMRLGLFVSHPIVDGLSGYYRFDYNNDPNEGFHSYHLELPGLTYSIKPWLQIWAGLSMTYTANDTTPDALELRPFAGPKISIPNPWHLDIYNYTRYEFRATEDRDTHEWTDVHRLRSRFGIEIPLADSEKAWEPRTFYLLGDVEPFYRFDRHTVDPLRFRGGLGWIATDRLTLEFIYTAQLTRPNNGGLAWTENVFRLQLRVGLQEGLLRRLFHPDVR